MIEKSSAMGITQGVLNVVSPMLGKIMEITTSSTSKTDQVAKSGSIDDLRIEAERQEITMRMAERQAKVAQELALAGRIETAEEVEMEEFYDISGSANAGIQTDGITIVTGVAAQGQKVTKRIFRFKGHNCIQASEGQLMGEGITIANSTLKG